MTRLLKFGCLFVTSHALIINNDSSQEIFLKTSPDCQAVYHQESIKIDSHRQQYLDTGNTRTLCIMVQGTQDNEEHVELIKILNTLNAQIRITEVDGKLSIQTAFC